MRVGLLSLLFGLIFLYPAVTRADTMYTYTGTSFTFAQPPYTTANEVTGFFTVAAPLPSSSPLTVISGLLTGWSFTDGQQTFSSPTLFVGDRFRVGTDASGNISTWDIVVGPGVGPGPYIGLFADASTSGNSGVLTGGITADNQDFFSGALGSWTVTAAPEPNGLALLGIGLSLFWFVSRRGRLLERSAGC
jgi:hypothetical protein